MIKRFFSRLFLFSSYLMVIFSGRIVRLIDRLYFFVDRWSTWPIIALLVVGVFLANQGFSGRREYLGGQIELLDGRRWYTPAQVVTLFTALEENLNYYALTEVTLDLFYPFVYGMLFAILIARTWGPWRAWMLLFPIVAVFFDLAENLTIVYMVMSYTGVPPPEAWFAAVCTLLKTIFFLVSLLLVLNGGVIGLFRRMT